MFKFITWIIRLKISVTSNVVSRETTGITYVDQKESNYWADRYRVVVEW